jgi:glucose dehydrogenase
VAVAGERLFMVTDHAHLIALNRFTGALLWDSTRPTGRRTTTPRVRHWSSATW